MSDRKREDPLFYQNRDPNAPPPPPDASADLRRQWEEEDQQDRFRVAAGVMEFVGVVAGVIMILLLLALLFSLFSWLNQDISRTFAILRTRFQ